MNSSANHSVLITNIGDLVTMAPMCHPSTSRSAVTEKGLGRIRSGKAWLVVTQAKVVAWGEGTIPGGFASLPTVNAEGQLVIPGLVDAHTHLIFAGSRAHEFAERLDGASYQDIAARGGGIQYTVQQTRQASNSSLLDLARERLRKLLTCGVTTVEIKSGYGLSVAEELRHLQVIRDLKKSSAQHLQATCLALHAVPPGQSKAAYVTEICNELLPRVAAGALAGNVDAFVEQGYYSVEDVEAYMRKARSLGLGIRVHADEFSDAGGALAAARWGAHSADHLQFASNEGVRAMASANVTAVLLPGTSLYSAIPFAQARRFREAGCPVAIASDWNPGSCGIYNLPLLASVAAMHCGLNVAETMAAITHNAAYTLGLQGRKGSLAIGADADFVLHPSGSVEGWLADMGQTPPSQVWISGQRMI